MNIKDKIQKILDTFGMSGVKASEIMGITYGTFKQKKSSKSLRHCFNEKNLNDLEKYIKDNSWHEEKQKSHIDTKPIKYLTK